MELKMLKQNNQLFYFHASLCIFVNPQPKEQTDPAARSAANEASGAPEGVTCKHPPRRPVKSVKVGEIRGQVEEMNAPNRLILLYRWYKLTGIDMNLDIDLDLFNTIIQLFVWEFWKLIL